MESLHGYSSKSIRFPVSAADSDAYTPGGHYHVLPSVGSGVGHAPLPFRSVTMVYFKTLEIKPVPTQRQRKAIKALPQVQGLSVDGGKTLVSHSAYEDKEQEVVDSLRALGFQVKGYIGWGIEETIRQRMKQFKKEKRAR